MANKLMGEIIEGKVIPRNFGNISHLPGSRLKDSGDTVIDEKLIKYFTEGVQFRKRDKVFVTEKVDGANIGVYKSGGKLYPIMRKGFDVRGSSRGFLREFGDFVSDNAERFDKLLKDGERVCGEWMIKTHSLFYDMDHEPFIVFDIIKGIDRPTYDEVVTRALDCGFKTTGLVNKGEASVEHALELMGKGFHGVCGGKPEGLVYRYERDGRYCMAAKYVSNSTVDGEYMDDENAWNKWKNWERHAKS